MVPCTVKALLCKDSAGLLSTVMVKVCSKNWPVSSVVRMRMLKDDWTAKAKIFAVCNWPPLMLKEALSVEPVPGTRE